MHPIVNEMLKGAFDGRMSVKGLTCMNPSTKRNPGPCPLNDFSAHRAVLAPSIFPDESES